MNHPDTPQQPAPATTLFIFGAHGDLMRRLLAPALYRLQRDGLLADEMQIHGVDHNPSSDENWRERLGNFLTELAHHPEAEGGGEAIDPVCWQRLCTRLHYLQGDFTDPATYRQIRAHLAGQPGGNALFYLATAPEFFAPIIEQLAAAGLLARTAAGCRHLALEKPFGTDLASARALNTLLLQHVDETAVFRIDHFSAKDAVRNLAAQRLANSLVDGFWHAGHIDHVQISALETLGTGSRGHFYERTGALRDMVPNHLFQLLAIVAMEPPAQLDPAGWRSARSDLIRAIRVLTPHEARQASALGQYTAGNGQPGYRETPNVAAHSTTETFAALRLFIDTERWRGVPFYLRTGKCLSQRSTQIVIQFRDTGSAPPDRDGAPARLIATLEPNETLQLDWNLRVPGPIGRLARSTLSHAPAGIFKTRIGSGYEAVLYHCLCGNQALFQTGDQAEAAWAVISPFVQAWHGHPPEPYPAGSHGPASAAQLLRQDARQWWRAEPEGPT